jgi:hypothetical protein
MLSVSGQLTHLLPVFAAVAIVIVAYGLIYGIYGREIYGFHS